MEKKKENKKDSNGRERKRGKMTYVEYREDWKGGMKGWKKKENCEEIKLNIGGKWEKEEKKEIENVTEGNWGEGKEERNRGGRNK